MRASAELIAGPGGRIERLADAAPVAWRPAREAVYLVGTAASPVGDDHVRIRVEVLPGASLTVRSAAATVAWSGRSSHHSIEAVVGAGASLDWALEPLIATAGCDHRQTVRVVVDGTGRLRWREELVLGRVAEDPGRIETRIDVECSGLPLLRHSLNIDRRPGQVDPSWAPSVLGSARAVGFELVAGADTESQPEGAGTGWALCRLDGPGVLLQALGPDIETLRQRMSDARTVESERPIQGQPGHQRPVSGGGDHMDKSLARERRWSSYERGY